MARTEWTRADRIALVSVLIAVVSCAAAIIVVPEFRQWLGLRSSEADHASPNANAASINENPTISNSNKKTTEAATPPKNELSRIILGANERGEMPEAYLESSLLSDSRYFKKCRIQFVDMSLSHNKRVYIKLSICNVDYSPGQLQELFVWYTPGGNQESVNWHFSSNTNQEPLIDVKGRECKIVGGWSDEVSESFRFKRPLGGIFFSDRKSFQKGPIDLEGPDKQGFVKVTDFNSN